MSALELIIIVACCAGSWFFSGIETGLISINKLRLRHLVRHKVEGAETLQFFLQNPDHLLGTTLVGNNIVNTVISVMAASIGTRWMGGAGSVIASAIVTLVLLVVCEYFPKAWFQSFPAKRCLPFAPLLALCGRVFYPLGRPLMKIVNLLVPGAREDDEEGKRRTITREELMHLASEGQKSGTLTQNELKMIKGVIELKTIACEEIMIPREKILYVHSDTTADDLQLFARQQSVNQLPVFDKEKNNFTGVVYIFDVLADENPKGKTAKDYMRQPQLVGRSTPVDHVLPRMRVTRQPVVLVTNETYEVVGMLTLENAVEEVVGLL